jgi:hypothetical protein
VQKHLLFFLAVVSLLVGVCSPPCLAYARCPQNTSYVCCSDRFPNNLQVEAEFLYFLPTFDDTYFVIQSLLFDLTTNPTGEFLNNDFDFCPGFRIGAAYSLYGGYGGKIYFDYTRLSDSQTRLVTEGFLWATRGTAEFTSAFIDYTGSALSNLDFLYHRIGASYTNTFWCDRCLEVSGFIGVEYASIRLREHYEYLSELADGIIDESAKTFGIGPQIGGQLYLLLLENVCCIPGSFALAAHASGSLLAGHSLIDVSNNLIGNFFFSISDEHTWRVIPSWHARLGLNYTVCFSCLSASVEVGYEFTSYLRALARFIIPSNLGVAPSYTNYYNFDVQGLYVNLGLSF